MRSITQVAKNGTRSVAAKQSKIARETVAPMPDPTCLVFFREGREVAGLDFSVEELEHLKRVAAAKGETLSDFLQAAMDARLAALSPAEARDATGSIGTVTAPEAVGPVNGGER